MADDDSDNRFLAEIIFSNWNIDFEFATDGEEALRKSEKKKYDLILMDIQMPKLSGAEVTIHIRTKPENINHNTKIVAITANILKGDIKKYIHTGMDAYVLKPFKEEELFNKICNTLKIKVPSKGTKKKPESKSNLLIKNNSETEYDIEDLMKASGGNKKLFNKMIHSFFRNVEQAVKEFNSSIEKEDWEEIRETAHRMLASFRYFKINQIADQLMLIEELVRNKTFNEIPPILNQSLSKINILLENMKKEVIL